jgi:two-component system nitrogen regulation response regulator NtrX
MTVRVLVADDERNLRRMLRAVLEADAYDVYEAENGAAALTACRRIEPDVVLLDLLMPEGPDGLAVLQELGSQDAAPSIIMMSGKATLGDAVRATKLGAFQFLEKPLTPESVLSTVAAAAELARARAENRALRAEIPVTDDLVGAGPLMARVREFIAQVAPTRSRVLITGESGTGKELVARAIHRASPRAKKPIVCVNCAALPRELLESEMFGHERGAFTGAVARRHGKFELADGSSLFLDEIAEMHPELQAKLLRVLESGTIERVGGEHEKAVDVRVIAATNKDPTKEVAEGRFREDLFYRLAVFPIHVPPLRDRKEDIPALVAHLATLAGARCGRSPRVFGTDAVRRMEAHDWPGNVREFANVVERLTIVGGDQQVMADEVDAVLGPARPVDDEVNRPGAPESGLSRALESYERQLIRGALDAAVGNIAEAARRLNTDRANLHRRMRRLGIRRSDTEVSI